MINTGVISTIIFSRGSCCQYTYEIKDANDTVIFTLIGPVLICDGPLTCCCENKFTVSNSFMPDLFCICW